MDDAFLKLKRVRTLCCAALEAASECPKNARCSCVNGRYSMRTCAVAGVLTSCLLWVKVAAAASPDIYQSLENRSPDAVILATSTREAMDFY